MAVLTSGVCIAFFYVATSILLISFNKAIISCYSFPAANLLTLSQSLCSLELLSVFRRCELLHYASSSTGVLLKLAPVSLSFLAYYALGMLATREVSIPMYTTLRRTTGLFVMLLE